MKKRNGFTLIELLAVIVILAIIALIATPIILGIIEDTKKDAFLNSVLSLVHTTDMDIVLKTYEDEYTYLVENGTVSNLDVPVNNTEEMNGSILYDAEGKEIYAIHNGVYCVRKMDNMSKAEVSDYIEGKCIISPVLKESDISSITFNDLEYTYDGTEKKIEVNNLLEGFTVTYENNKGTNVGEYRATAIITGENYRGSIKKEATLKINKASITLTAEDKTSDYGEGLVELTYQVTSGAIYNNDNLNVNLTKETGEEIGTYNITINGEHPNYEITFVNGVYTIILGFANDACFAFSGGRITNYYDYEENDSSKRACPRDVRIPETINGVTVTNIGYEAFEEKNITSVEFPSSVKSIGSSAFANNKLSGELDLSHLTGLTTINSNVFQGKNDGSTNQITSLKLPSSVTSIGNYAFSNNKLSGELDLSHLTSLTGIGQYAFTGSSSTNQITSIKLPSSVTNIGSYAFQKNKLSGELDLSHLTGLTSIGYSAFEGKSDGSTNQITSLKLPSSVTSIGQSAFEYNKLSGELDLSHLTGLIIIRPYAFTGSSDGITNQITNIKLPSSVTSIGSNAFQYNKLNGELDLSHLTGLTTIGSYAFTGSSNGSTNQITNIKLPSSVTSIEREAFAYNKLSSELDLSHLKGLKTILRSAFEGSSNGITNQITALKLPSSVTSIEQYAFANNKLSGELDLSHLTSLTSILGFSNNQITSIKLPSSVTSIGSHAFRDNKLSGELDLSHLTGLTSINYYAFEGSRDGSTNQITALKLPSSVTSIEQEAFAYNKLSGELDLSHLNGLTTIKYMTFVGSNDGSTNQITSVKLSNSVTSISNDAFRYNALTSVTFYGRSDLTGVTVGSTAWGWATGYSDANIYFEPTTE